MISSLIRIDVPFNLTRDIKLLPGGRGDMTITPSNDFARYFLQNYYSGDDDESFI
jgi:hypothetical protein